MPENTVSVTRPGKWGNPWKVGDPCVAGHVMDASGAVDHFRRLGRIALTRTDIEELRGKNLACWCKPSEPCHADVLLEWANGGEA